MVSSHYLYAYKFDIISLTLFKLCVTHSEGNSQ